MKKMISNDRQIAYSPNGSKQTNTINPLQIALKTISACKHITKERCKQMTKFMAAQTNSDPTASVVLQFPTTSFDAAAGDKKRKCGR